MVADRIGLQVNGFGMGEEPAENRTFASYSPQQISPVQHWDKHHTSEQWAIISTLLEVELILVCPFKKRLLLFWLFISVSNPVKACMQIRTQHLLNVTDLSCHNTCRVGPISFYIGLMCLEYKRIHSDCQAILIRRTCVQLRNGKDSVGWGKYTGLFL